MNAKRLISSMSLAAMLALATVPSSAQVLLEKNDDGVTIGHMHLMVRDVEAQKKFWTEQMWGKIVQNGPLEMVAIPGVFILFNQADDPAPPAGSVVDHFGFVVKDMPGAIAKWEAAGIPIEPTGNPNEVFITAPDDIRIEVYGIPDLEHDIMMNHVHYFVSDIPGMQKWYDDVFSSTTGTRLCVACLPREVPVQIGKMPGREVNLSYSNGAEDLAGTRGRAIDHVGFEVEDLDAFAAELDAKGIEHTMVREIAAANLKIMFLTDPWGTYIEVTEGLEPQP